MSTNGEDERDIFDVIEEDSGPAGSILDPVFEYLKEQFIETVQRRAMLSPASATETMNNNSDDVNPDRFSPLTDAVTGLFEDIESEIIREIEEDDLSSIADIEGAVDRGEQQALASALDVMAGALGIEIAGLTQTESHQFIVSQMLTSIALEDFLGKELEVLMEEAVMPSLEADVAKQHRTKFVDLPDAVEFLLRNKDGDSGWLQGDNIPREAYDRIKSNEPVNPDNALEEWGIRDDQLDILEEVSLEAMEFEELIETPAELGLIVDDDVLDQTLDLAGYPEDLKDFLREIPEEIPRTTRVYEERTTLEELVTQLDTLVADGEISPVDAVEELPAEAEIAEQALLDRWELLSDVPAGSPTRSQIESSFVRGYSSLEDYRERLQRLEYDAAEYEGVWQAAVLDELDGDLQEAVALGLLSEGAYSDYAEEVGLDDETVELLLQGQSFTDITKQRLQESTDPSARKVGTIVGIGESRARALDAAGVETVADLAGVDASDLQEVINVSPETAAEFINQARRRVQ